MHKQRDNAYNEGCIGKKIEIETVKNGYFGTFS